MTCSLVLIGAWLPFACEPVARAEAAPRCEGRLDPGKFVGRRTMLLGCARTLRGTRVELYAIRELGGPCLILAGLPGGLRACGRAPSERGPAVRTALGGPVTVRCTPHAPLELYGEALASVRRVVLRYRLPGGRWRSRPATLIRVRDPAALRAARVREPFGYFLGPVPPRATHVAAVALDRSGRVIGRLRFEQDMHPTVVIAGPFDPGEPLRCRRW